jgi:hypothetical protein
MIELSVKNELKMIWKKAVVAQIELSVKNKLKMIWKKAVVAQVEELLVFRNFSGGLRKTTKCVNHVSQAAGRDLNPGLPEY